MKRKFTGLAALLAIVIMVFAACGGGDGEQEKETAATKVPKDFALEGTWVDETSQRASMEITAGDNGQYDVEISWGSSATESTVWTFGGEFNREEGFLYYKSGRKIIETTDEEGNTSEEVKYEDGSGALVFEDGAMLWQDDKEGAGDECRFVRAE